MTEASLGAAVELRQLEGDGEARACAAIMAASEPWLAMGRDVDASLAVIRNPDREVWVAVANGLVVGFVVLAMRGGFSGYIQSIAVREGWRSRRVGHALLSRVEARVFETTPNIFLCVSAFNTRAQGFYTAHGYRHVGTLPDYVLAGHDELIMRKSIGPLAGYQRATPSR